MGLKALDVYQGDDWLTYRVPVAHMFDTLDRIRDLCRHEFLEASLIQPSTGAMPLPFQMVGEGDIDLFGIIVELCDDLSGAFDAVQAELSPYLQKETMLRWTSFEMQLHLKKLRQCALKEYQSPDISPSAIDEVLLLAERLRELLKKIDQ